MTKLKIHPRWNEALDSAKIRSQVAAMLDGGFGENRFQKASAKGIEDFCAELMKNGMGALVPAKIAKKVESAESVKESVSKSRLKRLTGEHDADSARCVCAAFAWAQGIDSVSYLYYGGWDEIDLSDSMVFECVDKKMNLVKKTHDIWKASCDAAEMVEDAMFWDFNTDSGAGDGTNYSTSLTIDLLTLKPSQGEYEWDEEEDESDDDDGDQYSDESPDED